MTDPVADVDPVAIAVAELKAAADILAEFGPGGADHVSALNEPPYPHVLVGVSPGGNDGRLLWTVTGEVALQVWGHPDGSPGRAELRRLLYLAVTHLARMPDRPHVPDRPVVVDVVAIGSGRWQPDPATKQPCWAHTLRITAHPDNS